MVLFSTFTDEDKLHSGIIWQDKEKFPYGATTFSFEIK